MSVASSKYCLNCDQPPLVIRPNNIRSFQWRYQTVHMSSFGRMASALLFNHRILGRFPSWSVTPSTTKSTSTAAPIPSVWIAWNLHTLTIALRHLLSRPLVNPPVLMMFFHHTPLVQVDKFVFLTISDFLYISWPNIFLVHSLFFMHISVVIH